MMPSSVWWAVACGLLALVAVYAYAAGALFAHARLARLAPPRSLAHALAIGALMPACGCTALAYARRAPERLRAPFIVAAYAANPLLVVAAGILAGGPGALAVLALALVAAALARALPPGGRPRARLDDLLLRRAGSPLRDAAPYAVTYAAPSLALGALVGIVTVAPAVIAGGVVAALAVVFAPPHRDVAEDHGARTARGVRIIVIAFALAAGAAVALLV